MKVIDTQILTPYGPVYNGQATGVNLPGSEGAFEIKFNHAALMAMLDIGKILVRESAGTEQLFTVNGGFVQVHKNKVTVLAESAERKEDIDVDRAEEAKKRAEEELKKQKTQDTHAELALKRAVNRIKVARL